MKHILFLYLFLLIIMLSCKTLNSGLISKELKNGDQTILIDIPNGNSKITQSVSPHGKALEIKYKDKALLFYNNDSGLPSPNVEYYRSVDFCPKVGKAVSDTVIAGEQNGKYWKEIFQHGYSFGYQNVNEKQKNLFDKSLSTFRKQ